MGLFKKRHDKMFALRLLIAVLAVVLSVMHSSSVFAGYESGNNDDMLYANYMNINDEMIGNISSSTDLDWYRFTIREDGIVDITFKHQDLNSNNAYWTLAIYGWKDGGNTYNVTEISVKGNETTKFLSNIGLAAGDYYICVKAASTTNTSTTNYSIKVEFTAASFFEIESNNKSDEANSIDLDTEYVGCLLTRGDKDWYSFYLSKPGKLSIEFNNQRQDAPYYNSYYWNVALYNHGYEDRTDFNWEIDAYSTTTKTPEISLSAGIHYIKIEYGNCFSDSLYRIKVNFTPDSNVEHEIENDQRAFATWMTLDTAYEGTINSNDDVDWFEFGLTKSGIVTAYIDGSVNMSLFDSDGRCLSGESNNSGEDRIVEGLPAGTYYLKVTGWSTGEEYSILISFSAGENVEKEDNNSSDRSTVISPNTGYKGSIGYYDDEDWYKFTLKEKSEIILKMEHPISPVDTYYWRLTLYDKEENELWDERVYGSPFSKSLGAFPAGTYYVQVEQGYYSSSAIYTLTVKTIPVKKAGWQESGSNWSYQRSDGTYPKKQWEKIGNKWYYFDANSYAVTGWKKIGKNWYYFSPVQKTYGQMLTGWQQIGKKWYFFKKDGVMASNEWCQGYWLNKNGTWTYKKKATWKKDKKSWWFGCKGWYAKSQWQKIDNKWYYFDAKGYITTGTKKIGKKTYKFNSSGACLNP